MTTPLRGTAMVMVPVLLIIVVMGVVLPGALWWLTNRMASARPPYARTRMDAFGVPMDPIDTWFADHAELPALRRLDVRTAVFGGRTVDEESLRPVARRLAAELLAGRIRSEADGRTARALSVAAAVELIVAAVLCLVSGHILPWLVAPGLYGVLTLILGLLQPRLLRRRLERALQINA
jgi:hypothetical protein